MSCDKCIHRYVCATRRKFVDTIFQETAVLDTKKTDGIFAAVAKMCTVYKKGVSAGMREVIGGSDKRAV